VIAGPLASAIGVTAALWAATAFSAACLIPMSLLPSVRALRRVEAAAPPVPA
jgi:hypothetical protein